jgi:H+-transporting ATPase
MSQPIVEKEAGPPIEEAPASEKRVREYKDFGHDEEVKPARTFLSLGLRVDFWA